MPNAIRRPSAAAVAVLTAGLFSHACAETPHLSDYNGNPVRLNPVPLDAPSAASPSAALPSAAATMSPNEPDKAARRAYCSGTQLDLKVPPTSSEPYVNLALGEYSGEFLLDYGATASSVEKGAAIAGAATVDLGAPKLPGMPETFTFQVFERGVSQLGVGPQRGVIGTDLLSRMVVELHYENANDTFAVFANGCDTSDLAKRGFWRIGQQGFFSAKAEQLSHVNVPVIYIDLAKGWQGPSRNVRVWAQIDSGYGDGAYPYSININDAYYQKLKQAHLPLQEIASIPTKDCTGASREDRVLAVPEHVLLLGDRTGGVMLKQSGFYLLLKAKDGGQCGGIGTFKEPAAQLASSFLKVFGRMIFEPEHENLWILPTAYRDQLDGAQGAR